MRLFCSLVLLLCTTIGHAQSVQVSVAGARKVKAKENEWRISKSELLAKHALSVVSGNGTVLSYDMSMVPVRGEYVGPANTKSAEMTPMQISWVQQCHYGDKFFFEVIKVSDGKGAIIPVNAFVLTIE